MDGGRVAVGSFIVGDAFVVGPLHVSHAVPFNIQRWVNK